MHMSSADASRTEMGFFADVMMLLSKYGAKEDDEETIVRGPPDTGTLKSHLRRRKS